MMSAGKTSRIRQSTRRSFQVFSGLESPINLAMMSLIMEAGNGNPMLAQMPMRVANRCRSHRSIPRLPTPISMGTDGLAGRFVGSSIKDAKTSAKTSTRLLR